MAPIAWAHNEQARFERHALEDRPLAQACETGRQVEARPIGAAAGAALRFLTAAIGARAVVEVGTGCGSSGIWLLRGMAPDAILTTVDLNPEYQEYARAAFDRAGFSGHRARLICGRAMEVLPRLTDGAYDLVLVDADPPGYPRYLEESLRLLRPGGIAVFNNALAVSSAPDEPLRAPDPAETAVREVAQRLREDDGLIPLLLPVGDGLLAAIRP